MVRSMRLKVMSIIFICAVLFSVLAVFLLHKASTPGFSAQVADSVQHPYNRREARALQLPYPPLSRFHMRGVDGPYYTRGNLIFGADNSPYLFHGVARDDLEYLCSGDGHYTAQELAYMGVGDNTGDGTYWGGNIVRLPLSESFWLNGSQLQHCSAAQYRAMVKKVVDTLTSLNLNVMLDLQWTDAGGQSPGAGDAWAMPDQDSVIFWHQVATIYKSYSNVLFELFNEPHPVGDNWACWRNGCAVKDDYSSSTGHDHNRYSYQGVGLQVLLDTVRQAGANNLVTVPGVNWGYNLSQLPSSHLKGSNVVYDTHPYPYADKLAAFWDTSFGRISAIYPVISGESGEYDCNTTFVNQLFRYFDAHDIGWIGWAWAPPWGDACHYPRLVSNLSGKPVAGMGQFVYLYLHRYLAVLAGGEVSVK